MQFNSTDPRHANAHLVFGFQCKDCESEISIDDFQNCDWGKDEDFLEYCVEASNLAISRGWVLIEEFSFLFPNCKSA